MRLAYGGFLAIIYAVLSFPGPSYWQGSGSAAVYAQPATTPTAVASPESAPVVHGAAWTTIAASNIVAVQTKWGVITSAEVQLKMCHEARIVARTKSKFDYVVQEEREPGAGDICGMAIRSATVAIAESGKAEHVHVTSADVDTAAIVPVVANAVVKF
jgi:hypothetical protein